MILTLALVLLLALVPMPDMLSAARPLWVPATALFWVLAAPRVFGLMACWCCGLVLDVLYGAPLGEHALALAVAAYLVIRLRETLWALPRMQQAALMLPVFAAYAFILFWVDGAISAAADPLWRWLPVATTTLLWPLGSTLLERVAANTVRR